MKKTLIVFMLVLLSAVLMVSCDDSKALPSVSKAGDTVTLGNVEWMALDVDSENKTALLISKDILEKRQFDADSNVYNYKDSDIRTYLLSDKFLTTYGLDKSYMKNTELTDASVTDYIFIPSEAEINAYLLQASDRIAKFDGKATDWWLRTPNEGKVRIVNSDGTINYQVSAPTENGMRPAFRYTWN